MLFLYAMWKCVIFHKQSRLYFVDLIPVLYQLKRFHVIDEPKLCVYEKHKDHK